MLYLPRRMPSPKTPGFGEAAAREVLEILRRTARPRLRAVHQLRRAARRCRTGDALAAVSAAGAGRRAANGPARAVPDHPERRAPRHLVLLAGGRRGGRTAELRDHRQAAVRLAGRSHHGGQDRGDHRRRRRCLPGLSGAAGGAGHAPGPGPADSASGRPGRAGGAGPPPPDHALRPALPRLVSSGPNLLRSGRHRPLYWRSNLHSSTRVRTCPRH